MLKRVKQILVAVGLQLKLIPIAIQIAEEIQDDATKGEPIVIEENRRYGSKLRDRYPFIALGVLAGMQVCHQTIRNPSGPDTVHIITPEAFVRSGLDLPRTIALWRYQDYWKFLDLLETEDLYLTSLKSLEDPLEGSPTESLLEMIETVESPEGLPFFLQVLFRRGRMPEIYQAFYRECCVNCWHINEEESTQMWDQCQGPNAVAIRTSVGDLVDAVEHECHAGTWKVHYLDYSVDRINTYDVKSLATHKDKKYRYEKEFRVVYANDKRVNGRMFNKVRLRLPERESAHIKVNLNRLIREILIHPQADSGFIQEIRDLVRDKLPGIPVERSRLARVQKGS